MWRCRRCLQPRRQPRRFRRQHQSTTLMWLFVDRTRHQPGRRRHRRRRRRRRRRHLLPSPRPLRPRLRPRSTPRHPSCWLLLLFPVSAAGHARGACHSTKSRAPAVQQVSTRSYMRCVHNNMVVGTVRIVRSRDTLGINSKPKDATPSAGTSQTTHKQPHAAMVLLLLLLSLQVAPKTYFHLSDLLV
jgi:hypothetical protein